MKFYNLLTSVLLCLVVFGTSVRSQNQGLPKCPNGTEASLSFTVIDRAGESPADVKKEDVTLKINGNLTPVVGLDRQTAVPIDLAILIDVSISQERALNFTRPAAKVLIQQLLRSPENRVALISFSNQVDVEKLLTSNEAPLIAALDEVKIVYPPGYLGGGVVVSGAPPPRNSRIPGSTSLWDTVTGVLENIFPSAGDKGRKRAVVLLTDGEDTASQAKRNAAIKTALDHGVAVYALGIESGGYTVNRDSLKKISEETGGSAAFPKKRDEVVAALVEIQNRLGSQYVVSFCSEAGPLKLRLDLTNPKFRDTRLAYRRQ
jgi:VWFA-related protein